ncbi:MAG: sulfite exporter TauE/SafE family protein [Magnetococcales bacterium]|nr:sulfite exporter TauE/SafE family protein [Magnetococcales bacterium]
MLISGNHAVIDRDGARHEAVEKEAVLEVGALFFLDNGVYATLFVVGMIAGVAGRFVGSDGSLLLTPIMMGLGLPGLLAVGVNMGQSLPKLLIGTLRRHKLGQVDWSLGFVVALLANLGLLVAVWAHKQILQNFGESVSNLLLHAVTVSLLMLLGVVMVRRWWLALREEREAAETAAPWLHPSRGWLLPVGLLGGILSALLGVSGIFLVPAMISLLAVPPLLASGTALLIAFLTHLAGVVLFALQGWFDLTMAASLLLGSLMGIQLGKIGSTSFSLPTVRLVVGMTIMMVLFYRLIALPGYWELAVH